MRGAHDGGSPVCLAELVATLSLAADLGLGQPPEHAVRSGFVALGLAERLGLGPEERTTTFWVNLLAWVGCTADSHELARLFGDDIQLRSDSYLVDLAGLPQLVFLLRHAGAGRSARRRLAGVAGLVAGGAGRVARAMATHCEVTGQFASRFGLGPAVAEALAATFARWDGQGLPEGLAGDEIPRPARLLQLADVVVAHHGLGGTAQAVDVARRRRGTQFDPALVDLFAAEAGRLFDDLEGTSAWDQLIAADPALRAPLGPAELDEHLEVLADFADLKSPYFLGHSRGVADLAGRAAAAAGQPAGDVELVRRAALVHDIGRAGVPNTIWDKAGSLTPAERERVRMHDYFTDRMLRRPAALAAIGAVAGAGHERPDGSGYPRRARGPAIHPLAAFLAAADAYHAMGEPRPHRPALGRDQAAATLRTEAREGRFDVPAVEAVLAVAGHTPRRRPSGPGGLTAREIEVLSLIARGSSTRQVAHTLGITPRTAGSHVEHIYTKIGVSTRAAAALYAVQHGLLGDTA